MVAHYLYLFHEGVLSLTCSVNTWLDCGKVSGPQATFSSIVRFAVALIGLLGYAGHFMVVWLADVWPPVRTKLPVGEDGWLGTAVLAWANHAEAFVIRAFCQYCLISLAIVVTMAVLVGLELGRW